MFFYKKASIRVHHGYRPEVGGPFVKLERMNRYFPDHRKGYNVVYGVSGVNFPVETLETAKRKKIPIVCHFNSCWHPAYAEDWEDKNYHLRRLYEDFADFVVFGSEQAKRGAEKYFRERDLPYEKIFNAVDIDHFVPVGSRGDQAFTVLAAGFHQFRHRLEPLIRALPLVQKKCPDLRLVIAGKLHEGEGIWDCGKETVEKMIKESGAKNVSFISEYGQNDAPKIYQQADVLVHLKHMDWTPNVVAEAMACGLPVVHTGNGGVPEIVKEAGVSLEVGEDWDHIHSASVERVAEAILEVKERREALSGRAREIAVREFDLKKWVARHEEIFKQLIV